MAPTSPPSAAVNAHEPVAGGAGSAVGPIAGGRPARFRGLPRNYLARREQRRIFWLFMPPAIVVMILLGQLERSWLERSSPPARPQIDTRLAPAGGEAGPDDAVTIAPVATPPAGGPEELGASAHALSQVRDDAIFRSDDEEAWYQTWMTLRGTDARALARAPVREVGFAELFGQPRAYRGRLVRFRGTLHRLERMTAPRNQYDVREYWQGWLEPEGGPASPIVVYFLRLPEGMPRGPEIRADVEVVGYFFKRWAYAATDAVRIAPLVMALEPIWRPRPSGRAAGGSIGGFALVAMAALVLLTALGLRVAAGAPARRRQTPPDLAALRDQEWPTTEESLRRLAEADRRSADQLPGRTADEPLA
jgi:hypothetical protein